MSVAIILAALLLLRLSSRPWATAVAALVCVIAGLDFPDIDLWLPIGHRSALTHSLIVPAMLAAWPEARPAAAGLALGIGFHLAADCFPEAMLGYARVRIPLLGTLGSGASYAWLGANAAGALLLGAALLRRQEFEQGLRLLMIVAILALGGLYLLRVDGGWWALATFASLWLVASRGRMVLPAATKFVRARK